MSPYVRGDNNPEEDALNAITGSIPECYKLCDQQVQRELYQ